MKLRGYLTVAAVGICLIVLDPVQRTAVAGLVRLMPARRARILGAWQRFMAWLMITIVTRVGGAQVPTLPRVPGRPGVLVVMNHQSLLDIPIMCGATRPLYPRIVTRSRYARGKPLISHMVRLYQYPVVDPRATGRGRLEGIEEAARTSAVPLGIFPEGHRARDGDIGGFKRGGLAKILGARSWEVHLLVADGFWRTAKLDDFLTSVGDIRGAVRHLGPFRSPEPGEPLEPFIEELRARMVGALAEMREPSSEGVA